MVKVIQSALLSQVTRFHLRWLVVCNSNVGSSVRSKCQNYGRKFTDMVAGSYSIAMSNQHCDITRMINSHTHTFPNDCNCYINTELVWWRGSQCLIQYHVPYSRIHATSLEITNVHNKQYVSLFTIRQCRDIACIMQSKL